MAQTEILLLADVHGVGKSGDIVRVRPGFARNFLMPTKKARLADANARRMQKRLQEERAKQAVVDRQEADQLAAALTDVVLSITVKVDQEGNLYGSVSAQDIVALLAEKGFVLEKRFIALQHPIKTTGEHVVNLRLKEGVAASVKLIVQPES